MAKPIGLALFAIFIVVGGAKLLKLKANQKESTTSQYFKVLTYLLSIFLSSIHFIFFNFSFFTRFASRFFLENFSLFFHFFVNVLALTIHLDLTLKTVWLSPTFCMGKLYS